MKTLFKTFIFSLLAISTFAQEASEIDPKFVKLPRYANQFTINTEIPTPTQGMMVYRIADNVNLFYNGTAWVSLGGGGLILPYSASQAYASLLFSLTNTGPGPTAEFQINNATSTATALYTLTNGLGSASNFIINNPLNTNDALVAGTNGTGSAGNFSTEGSFAPTILSTASGLGSAGNFQINNFTSNANTLYSRTNGISGSAGYFENFNTSSGAPSIYARARGVGPSILGINTGTGGAGLFQISNVSNPETALTTSTNGLGYASIFTINNPINIYPALSASTNGTGNALNANNTGSGKAGEFLISAPTNGAATVTATNNGIGRAIIAQIGNGTNSSTALLATTNGTGRAIDANNTSSTQPTISIANGTNLGPALEITGGIKVSGTNKAAFKIVTSAPFIAVNKFGIQNTTLANASSDILSVTYEHTGGAYLLINKTFATSWNGGNWEIHLTDGTTMPIGVTFNVLVIKQ